MNKKTVAAGVAAFLMAAPALALAQSTSTVDVSTDVQAQIQSLLSQIESLQQQLKSLLASSTIPAMHDVGELVGSTTPAFMGGDHGALPCLALTRNLSIGSHGDDVKQLQNILAEDPVDGFTASSTGFFGPMTAHALINFQMRMDIASSSTGFVGPLTRAFFKDRCGSDNGVGNGGMNNGVGNAGAGAGIDNGIHGGVMIRVVSGTISATDVSSITVLDRASSNTVTVNITASSTIMVASTSSAPVAGTIANLTTGANVIVEGHNGSNGSVDATRITVGTGLPTPPVMDDNGDEMMHDAASTTHGMMQGFMQLFNPFVPHSDN